MSALQSGPDVLVYEPFPFSPRSRYIMRDTEEIRYFASRGGAPEAALIEWAVSRFGRPGMAFVDVGAHIGTWSQHFALRGCKVYAFEPQRDTFYRLCGGVALAGLSDSVTCERLAIGNPVFQTTTLSIVSEDGGGSTTLMRHELGSLLRTEQVEAADLNDYGFGDDGVCLVKIDVEGAESEVLHGAYHMLEQEDWPPILAEAWLHPWYASERKSLWRQLESYGYEVKEVLGWPEMLLAEKPR